MDQKLHRIEIEQISFEYVKLLLEIKYGCRVASVSGPGDSSTMEVWSPKGFSKSKIQVNVGSNDADTVPILIARIINGRKVPVIPNYHLIKFLGVDGVYCLEEKDLQQFLLDSNLRQELSDDGCAIFAHYDRKLLLDSCTFIAA